MTQLDKKFMEIVDNLTLASGCIREDRCVGAIAVKDGEIIAKGVNGDVRGISCEQLGYCVRQKQNIPKGTRLEVEYCIHAEQALIINAMNQGKNLGGSTVYVSHAPCAICLRLLCESGVVRIVYEKSYPDGFSMELAKKLPVKMEQFKV